MSNELIENIFHTSVSLVLFAVLYIKIRGEAKGVPTVEKFVVTSVFVTSALVFVVSLFVMIWI